MNNKNSILFLGYGYVAQYFCKAYSSETFDIGASINSSKEKYFEASEEIKTINFSKIDHSFLDNYNNFIISIPPFYQLKTDVIIDKFHSYFLHRKTPYTLIYLSATSVYGDHNGNKVQEDSELKAKSVNGLARIECEKRYFELQNNEVSNIITLRLAGIYGDKRNNILAIKNREVFENQASSRMISRIHVLDIVSIIKKIVLNSQIKNQIFNLSDNNPCPTNEVNDYICEEILKIDKFPFGLDKKEVRHSSFALDNKVVCNQKIKKLLNYEFVFPSYKDGLNQISNNLSF